MEKARLKRVQNDQPKKLPLRWEFWSNFPLAWVYAIARGYLVLEVFLQLRVLNITAFRAIN